MRSTVLAVLVLVIYDEATQRVRKNPSWNGRHCAGFVACRHLSADSLACRHSQVLAAVSHLQEHRLVGEAKGLDNASTFLMVGEYQGSGPHPILGSIQSGDHRPRCILVAFRQALRLRFDKADPRLVLIDEQVRSATSASEAPTSRQAMRYQSACEASPSALTFGTTYEGITSEMSQDTPVGLLHSGEQP